ncbi:hypothetical protein L7F22_011631 [Adiantum nelumboides]|nr:hypothetical protein [Adiantum nelumboides]
MMRGGTLLSPKEEEGEDPEPKRSRRDVEDESKERVKLAIQEQVQALAQLVEDRSAEVHKAEEDVRKAELQLAKARKRLADAEAQLARTQSHLTTGAPLSFSSSVKVKAEQDSDTPSRGSMEKEKIISGKLPLVLPGSNGHSGLYMKGGLGKRPSERHSSPAAAVRNESVSKKTKAVKSESGGTVENRPVRKRSEPKESVELVPSIRGSRAPGLLRMLSPDYVNGQHKRKLRSLDINPSSKQLCATSALDGLIHLWQIEGRGSGLSFLSSVDCLSPKQRRWPEDMVWHPSGDSLFACYSADGGDDQVAVIDTSGKMKVKFLEDKPHTKGIINNLVFLPWGNDSFVTGGSDHAVCLWEEKEVLERLKWKAKILHKSQHSSAVMSVASLRHKELVLSGGADKRVVGHDTRYNRSYVCYTLESKAMGVLPNPADFNLFMVQTGTPGQQLHLYDIRVQRTELHVFGWKQESSDSQSALINQSWSPDGFYIASGSTDPKIHIFDIRYNSKEPSQSVRAHQKRVFKAAWHHTLPLLVSISSDLNIGLLRYAS